MILQLKQVLTALFLCFCFTQVSGQNQNVTDKELKDKSDISLTKYRADNVFTSALGVAVINGDYPDPLFEFYGQVGYKRYINPYVNVNFTYNKFNLAHKNIVNNGYMSFDLNVESTLMPYKLFTPFVFAGGGINASNYFLETGLKIQGGFGVEYLVLEDFGVKLFTDYNHTFDDDLDGKVYGKANDIFWRIGFGVNYYFGIANKKNKIPAETKTIINSNPIIYK
ncbi:Curli production assembly/transport component CsgG [Lacinutrix sp. C3R15]|uniref:Curli production assembly/transport component CsgG n=1 Tax=Flavobacteriaceae TaxID=49546 RepID=UPI001C097EFC|nr:MULTISPECIES: Curli production assembly/transport component CsgG [Flavobacteriaceae]MBU2940274.1 Curli production assembly/transport component CsgG [Lacinutrix sp. C3R15]MDO6623593.1 Curli production assembly/transport component CsgG [Oceanihabitans sp. 1_MG-2023]